MCADVSLVTVLVLVVVSVVAGDLVLENMVMRTKKFRYTDKSDTDTDIIMLCDVLLCSPQDNEAPSPMVGGGILERKIISAR